MIVDNVTFDLQENDLLIIPAGVSHWIRLKEISPYRRIVMNVSLDYIRSLGLTRFEQILKENAQKVMNFSHSAFLKAFPQFSQIAATEISLQAQRALFDERLLALYYSLQPLRERETPTQSERLVDRAVQYINDNLEKKLSIESISEQLYTSGSYLCKTFRKKMGIPLMHYVNRQRIFHAKELILDDVPLKEVCLRCGYENYITFFRVFRAETGQSPTAFSRGG